jgi:hypothetical protein
MNKINIISAPDKIYNDSLNMLVMYPSPTMQADLQAWLLELETLSLNVYFYDEQTFSEDKFTWLLDVFNFADLVLIDIDSVPTFSNVKHILSYMIAKPKTYWLTSHGHIVYNYISNNRIYDLSFLSNIGVLDVKKQ